MKNTKLIISQLNELLALNYYAEKIYLDALNEVENEDLKHFCRAMAFERIEFCRFLGAEILQLKGNPKYPDHMRHESNMLQSNFRYTICVNDNKAIIDELIRIKTWSIEKYEESFKKVGFPEHIFTLLKNQKSILEQSLASVRSSSGTFNQFLRTAN
ncbi:DUF2383 domain-containing protein [Algibacter mikhailovii]|uniref:DUF2383 domain-containing protein n=1 Tax=Algibacter mikhailovii TaxID=425498 RepID=A0A918VBY9_9FLAO|nr:DUF2383 domain-containing protein [Algibacter mikhailovii]GGZ85560.1 hypothetical protein GCM10007028_24780 [Algibacter mikhailovii]